MYTIFTYIFLFSAWLPSLRSLVLVWWSTYDLYICVYLYWSHICKAMYPSDDDDDGCIVHGQAQIQAHMFSAVAEAKDIWLFLNYIPKCVCSSTRHLGGSYGSSRCHRWKCSILHSLHNFFICRGMAWRCCIVICRAVILACNRFWKNTKEGVRTIDTLDVVSIIGRIHSNQYIEHNKHKYCIKYDYK